VIETLLLDNKAYSSALSPAQKQCIDIAHGNKNRCISKGNDPQGCEEKLARECQRCTQNK